MKKLRTFLLGSRIAPKWLIFITDILLSQAALLLALLLTAKVSDSVRLVPAIGVLALSNLFFFALFKVHVGIIRLSSFTEAVKSIGALCCSVIVLVVVNAMPLYDHLPVVICFSALVIWFFTASFFLYGYRLLVKHIYTVEEMKEKELNVAVCGIDLVKTYPVTMLKQVWPHYRIVAFLEDNPAYIGKSIDHVSIFDYSKLQSLVEKYKITAVIFAKAGITIARKNELVDMCLKCGARVFNVPAPGQGIESIIRPKELLPVGIDELLGRPVIELNKAALHAALRSKRILVTGAAGSIGSEIARQLTLAEPATLIICDKNESGLYELEYELRKKCGTGLDIVLFLGNITNKNSMVQLFSTYRPDVVFHAAAYKHVPVMEAHPSEAVTNNVYGTMVLADLAQVYGVEKFLLVSSDKAVNASSVMGATKRIAEMYCHLSGENAAGTELYIATEDDKQSNTRFIITRFGNVLHSSGSVIPRFKQQIDAGGPVTVTHPDISRYFMTIQEACSLVLEAVTMSRGNETYVFDMGSPVKILTLAEKMIRLSGKTPYLDIPIIFTGLRPGEKLSEELLFEKEELRPTHHPKIRIARFQAHLPEYLALIQKLVKEAKGKDDLRVLESITDLIEGFEEKRAIFEDGGHLTKTRV